MSAHGKCTVNILAPAPEREHGVCGTCRAKVLSGEVRMRLHRGTAVAAGRQSEADEAFKTLRAVSFVAGSPQSIRERPARYRRRF